MIVFTTALKGKRFRTILGALAFASILLALLFQPVFADDPPPPERRVVTKVADEGYLWWLKQWKDGEIVCELLVAHSGLPTWEEVSKGCGSALLEEWIDTPPCFEAADGEDTSDCEGVFLLFAGYLEGERTVVEELPKPSISLSLIGCEKQNLSNYCIGEPVLLFQAVEPITGEYITGVTVEIEGEEIECKNPSCEIALRPYRDLELEIEFWADSSYGDTTPVYDALVRPVLVAWEADPAQTYWQVEVLSTQWVGPTMAACALSWGSLPPVEAPQQWLSTPDDPLGLATDEPLDLLAGRLLRWGLVEAPNCPFEGLLLDGTASPCGVEATREAVYEWQDRFDERIFTSAIDKGLPATLIKRIFAHESQFWPGRFPNLVEYGLGSMHVEGTDTLLLWNLSYYRRLCPLVLSEESCAKRYHELDIEAQEMLRGALVVQADISCPECPNGIDLEKADQTVDLFADLILANCNQTGEVIRQTFNTAPGDAATYPDLWRLTLANYNAGSGCLYEALDDMYRERKILVWPNVREALLELDGCQAAVDYVETVTRQIP